jgi:uncharacterized protein (TIGR00290 family)
MLRQQAELEVVALLTTMNEAADRVAMHAVRRTLVEAQAAEVGLPLWSVSLPWPCSNDEYERRMSAAMAMAKQAGITHVAFGDLFLEDVRAYRVRQLTGTGIDPMFPLWGSATETPALAGRMVEAGLKAVLTCVDPKQLAASFVGRRFDASLLAELPADVDPCGERGEFHTFCFDGPMFTRAIPVQLGAIIARDGFCYADLMPGSPAD